MKASLIFWFCCNRYRCKNHLPKSAPIPKHSRTLYSLSEGFDLRRRKKQNSSGNVQMTLDLLFNVGTGEPDKKNDGTPETLEQRRQPQPPVKERSHFQRMSLFRKSKNTLAKQSLFRKSLVQTDIWSEIQAVCSQENNTGFWGLLWQKSKDLML